MSIKAMNWAWELRGLSVTTKCVLLALADHADNEGICWPGRKGVAEKVGVSDRTVDKSITECAALGLIHVEHRVRADGSNTTNRYFLQLRAALAGAGANATHLAGGSEESSPYSENPSPYSEESSPTSEDIFATGTPIEPSENHQGTIKSATAQPKKARKRMERTLLGTGDDLLALFSEEEETNMAAHFPGIDLSWEANKCVTWHNGKDGAVNWRSSYLNWLGNAKPKNVSSNGKAYIPGNQSQNSDRQEYLRRYGYLAPVIAEEAPE